MYNHFNSTEGSITAMLMVTPPGLVPESIGFVQACVMLDNEPTGDILITLQTIGGNAQGMLLFICKITIIAA